MWNIGLVLLTMLKLSESEIGHVHEILLRKSVQIHPWQQLPTGRFVCRPGEFLEGCCVRSEDVNPLFSKVSTAERPDADMVEQGDGANGEWWNQVNDGNSSLSLKYHYFVIVVIFARCASSTYALHCCNHRTMYRIHKCHIFFSHKARMCR